MTQQAVVRFAIKDNVFIHFVGYEPAISVAHDVGQRVEIVERQDRAGRVVREVQDDQLRPGIDSVGDALPVRVKVVTICMAGS